MRCLIQNVLSKTIKHSKTVSKDQPAATVSLRWRTIERIAAGLLVSLVAGLASAEPRCADLDTTRGCRRYAVSLVQLIANPDQFDGKRVLVSGFLNLEFEGRALYLHQDDFRMGNTSDAVALELPENWLTSTASIDCPSNRYVRLEGEFHGKKNGHLGQFAGSLKSVERCGQRSMRALE